MLILTRLRYKNKYRTRHKADFSYGHNIDSSMSLEIVFHTEIIRGNFYVAFMFKFHCINKSCKKSSPSSLIITQMRCIWILFLIYLIKDSEKRFFSFDHIMPLNHAKGSFSFQLCNHFTVYIVSWSNDTHGGLDWNKLLMRNDTFAGDPDKKERLYKEYKMLMM